MIMNQLPRHIPLVVTTRGGVPELVHVGSIAVVDERGALLHSAGDPRALNFTRSALKPLQALPLVEADGIARLGFTSHELALMCASHNGEAIHVEIARRMLARIDAREDDLHCGRHTPYFYAATETAPPPARWSTVFHNCSGKHCGFLAGCRLHREALPTYLDRDAPVQRRIAAAVRDLADGDALAVGTDGCSAPNYALPLTRLAQLFCRLAVGATPALAAISYAMTRHPDIVSGAGRIDLALMQTGRMNRPRDEQGDWVSKIGADGVQAIGIKSRGIGIAIRIADGNARALHAATAAVLEQLDLLSNVQGTPLARFARPVVRNLAGVEVGRVEPIFSLRG
jgi:L-asparaginase II